MRIAAQLACPHLATSRVVDYAGHPSFQCTGQFRFHSPDLGYHFWFYLWEKYMDKYDRSSLGETA